MLNNNLNVPLTAKTLITRKTTALSTLKIWCVWRGLNPQGFPHAPAGKVLLEFVALLRTATAHNRLLFPLSQKFHFVAIFGNPIV